jgi:4-hydroxybenzoyl-CoA reductase subunit beta
MLRLPPFTHYAPKTIDEVVKVLSDYGPEAMVVAGGTDLYPNMKRRQFEPKVLVGLRQVRELGQVSGSAEAGLSIGACVTLRRLGRHPVVAPAYTGLVRAAIQIANPQIQNVGTIGGNLCVDTRCYYYDQTFEWRTALGYCLKKDGPTCPVAPGGSRCWAVTSTDLAPVMISLRASVRLIGPRGERVVPVSELYRDDGIQYLTKERDEILTDVILPPVNGLKTTYLKLRRRGSFDFPVLGVAVALQEEAGTCVDARIVVGGVNSRPMEIKEAGDVLRGERITPELIERAAEAVYRPVKALDNTDFVPLYRKRVAPVFVKRALRELVGLAEGV